MMNSWKIGSVDIERVRYFDTPLPADSIGLAGVADSLDWSTPWVADGDPLVGQAFWVVRSAGTTIVVDPCGASDPFLRTGPDGIGHQDAAFAALSSGGCDPASVDHVVLTHLDGIGMAARSDGGADGEEVWSPAFPAATVLVSRDEYDFIAANDVMGDRAFAALDEAGVVEAVDPPHELAPGVTLRQTGGHSPGHCCVDIASDGVRAIVLGHLAVSPLHAAAPPMLHTDPATARDRLDSILDAAHAEGALVIGSLWPTPGAARVTGRDPYVMTPA